MNVNIIIIGAAFTTKTLDSNDFESWNNPKQADITVLNLYNLYFDLNKYNINIKCFDYIYPKKFKYNNIEFFNTNFILGDITALDINAHNIIIEFCNLYNNNWCSCDYEYKLKLYEDYKISYLTCGCLWDKYFPFEQIKIIIDNKLYTPINPFSIDSYLKLITIMSFINENKYNNILLEYKQGIYDILGSLLFRGYNLNYTTENVLYELFSIIELTIFNSIETEQFNNFLSKKIHWNFLSKNIRTKIIFYLYGDNLNI